MTIGKVLHRGLHQLLEGDNTRFLREDLVAGVRRVLTALVLADDMDGFRNDAPPGWRVEPIPGDRWCVLAPGNLRVTFKEALGVVDRLDLEEFRR